MPNGATKECRIGYSIAIEANKKIREQRAAEWQSRNDMIAKNFPEGDAKKEALLNELKGFFETQIPSEEEVRVWCMEPEGQLFCFATGSGLSVEDAKAAYDSLNEEQLLEMWHSLWVVFRGKSQADAIRKERQLAAKADADKQEVEYVARQEIITLSFNVHAQLGTEKYRELMDAVMSVHGVLGHEEMIKSLGDVLDKAEKAEKAKTTKEPLPGQKELF
jgi:hypothetical protein